MKTYIKTQKGQFVPLLDIASLWIQHSKGTDAGAFQIIISVINDTGYKQFKPNLEDCGKGDMILLADVYLSDKDVEKWRYLEKRPYDDAYIDFYDKLMSIAKERVRPICEEIYNSQQMLVKQMNKDSITINAKL